MTLYEQFFFTSVQEEPRYTGVPDLSVLGCPFPRAPVPEVKDGAARVLVAGDGREDGEDLLRPQDAVPLLGHPRNRHKFGKPRWLTQPSSAF